MKKATYILLMVISVSIVRASARQQQTIISGHVLRAEDQTPVEGAVIEMFLHQQFSDRLPARQIFEEPYKKAVTDPNGYFRYELELEGSSRGPLLLVTRKKGLALGLDTISGRIFSRPGEPQHETVTILLSPPVSLEGKVTDTEGQGVSDAHVGLFYCNIGKKRFRLGGIDALSTYTDSTGSFKLECMPSGRMAQIIVSKPGMGRTAKYMSDLSVDKKLRPLTFTLKPAANLKGVLIDKSTGQPVIFSELSLSTGSTGGVYYSCRTDMKGNFLFEDLSADTYTLRYSPFGTDYSDSQQEIVLEAGTTAEITYELFKGGTAAFFAADLVQEKPLDGVKIYLSSDIRGNMATDTGPTGRTRWRNLEPGEYVIHEVYKRGYLTNHCNIEKSFMIESGKTTQLEFFLTPSPHFKGIVLDTEQKPVSQAEIVLFTREPFSSHGYRVIPNIHNYPNMEQAVTDSEGRFDILWDAADKTPVPDYVFARCAEKNLAVLHPVITPPDELCRIQLQKGVTIAGQAENPQGQPLADVKVKVFLSPVDEKHVIFICEETSDKDGVFEVPAIPRNCSIKGWLHHDDYRISPSFQRDAPLQEEFIILEPLILRNENRWLFDERSIIDNEPNMH